MLIIFKIPFSNLHAYISDHTLIRDQRICNFKHGITSIKAEVSESEIVAASSQKFLKILPEKM